MSASSRGARGHLYWIKARRSNGATACVEIAASADGYHVRDSKNGVDGPVLDLSPAEWDALRAKLTRGESRPVGTVRATRTADGGLILDRDGVRLCYTPFEVECFLDGLRAGEFTDAALLAPA